MVQQIMRMLILGFAVIIVLVLMQYVGPILKPLTQFAGGVLRKVTSKVKNEVNL